MLFSHTRYELYSSFINCGLLRYTFNMQTYNYFITFSLYFGNLFNLLEHFIKYKTFSLFLLLVQSMQLLNDANERMMVYFMVMMVKCSLMMVKWVYDHILITPSLTSISPSLTSILQSLAWSKPSFVHLTIIEKLHWLHYYFTFLNARAWWSKRHHLVSEELFLEQSKD